MRHAFPLAVSLAALVVAASAPAQAQTSPGYEAARQAYALLDQGRASDAVEAARRAATAEPANLDYGLLLADALLRAERPEEAYQALRAYSGDDYRLLVRRAQAATQSGLTQEAAAAWEGAARTAPDAEARAYAARSQIAALIQLGDLQAARAAFARDWASGVLRGPAPLDTAYLAIAVGDDETAQALFAEADRTTPVSGRAALDAGYSARRLGRDEQALIWFSRGLDSAERGEIELTPQQTHEIRREVETLQRRWGFTATISRGASTVDSAVSPGAESVTQAGAEAYWRLGGDNNGRPLDLFARAYGVVEADAPWATGGDTVQGWVGLRWKPISQTNLVLEASRMIAIGDLARNDTMLRASWSAEQGGDLRYDRSNWPSWRLYADLAHIVEDEQTLGLADARTGWTWRLGERDLITPHIAVRAYYDDWQADTTAFTAGPGVTWRRWFRASRYGAPASYFDLWLGYDFNLSGDDRGEGVVIGATIRY